MCKGALMDQIFITPLTLSLPSEPLVALGFLSRLLNWIEDVAHFLFRKSGLPNRRWVWT
jgi:hypothetical protein